MEEKFEKEKSLTLSEFFSVFKRNLIWVIVIVVAFLGIGGTYAYLLKKTTYTATINISVRAYDSNDESTSGEFAEHLKYQYSALIAPEFEKVLKTYEMQRKVNAKVKEFNDTATEEEKIDYINLNALSFIYTDESAFFNIAYSTKNLGGDANAIKDRLVRSVNFYIDESIVILNGKDSNGKNNYGFLADKLYVDSHAYPDNVGVSTGRTSTIILSGLIGIIFACLFVIVIYFVDDRITTVEQVERISQQVVLSVIDISPNFKSNNLVNEAIIKEQENVGGAE